MAQFFGYLIENGVNKQNMSYSVSHFVNLPLKLIVSFLILLLECVIINTFLSQLDCVREMMILKHKDPLSIKKRGYNSQKHGKGT